MRIPAWPLYVGVLLASLAPHAAEPRYRVLVVNTGWYPSVPDIVRRMGDSCGFAVDSAGQTDSSAASADLSAKNLSRYRAVVMNNTLSAEYAYTTAQRRNLMGYFRTHGHVAIHFAIERLSEWPEYRAFLGAGEERRSGGTALIRLDSGARASLQPMIRGMPESASVDENWYAFGISPRLQPDIQVLYTLDESTCPNCPKVSEPNHDHPVVWIREGLEGGRMFYMAMGSGSTMKASPSSRGLLAQAIQWAARDSLAAVRIPFVAKPQKIGASSADLQPAFVQGQWRYPGGYRLRADGKRNGFDGKPVDHLRSEGR